MNANKTENDLSYIIIGAAIKLHKTLGPGLLESVYERALCSDLQELGLTVESQVSLPFTYKETDMEKGLRMDLLVNNKVAIEIKSIDIVTSVHFAQTLTYLKLSQLKLGLLINFNEYPLKKGIHRIVNGL